MKRIFILFASIPLLFAAGCASDEPDYQLAQKVEIVSADLAYSPGGGTGTIVTKATGTLTATSSVDWCSVSVSGPNVNVSVAPYDGLENRYAKIEIKSQDGSSAVTLHQYGMYFDLEGAEDSYHVQDRDAKVEIPLTHYNHVPDGVADVDWLSSEIVGENLVIKAEDNMTGKPRVGKFSIGTKTMTFVQWSYDTSFAGEFEWRGTTTLDGTTYASMKVSIKDIDLEAKKCTIVFNDLGNRELRVPFDPETNTLRISGGLYAGEIEYNSRTAYVFSMIYASGYVSWSTSYYADFPLTLDLETCEWSGKLTDRGSYSGKVVSAIYFELFNSKKAESSSRLKVNLGKRLYNNTLTRM